MSAQEIIAMFRYSGCKCSSCKRIVHRYEKTLKLSTDDINHLKGCILK